jgi:hypothetical protein
VIEEQIKIQRWKGLNGRDDGRKRRKKGRKKGREEGRKEGDTWSFWE